MGEAAGTVKRGRRASQAAPSVLWRGQLAAGFAASFLSAIERRLVQVLVRDNNVDQALRALKKKMQREGVFREMKRRRFYEKPSEQTNRE